MNVAQQNEPSLFRGCSIAKRTIARRSSFQLVQRLPCRDIEGTHRDPESPPFSLSFASHGHPDWLTVKCKGRVAVLQCTHCVTHQIYRMSEATFTFRVDGELKKQFAMAAKERDRTGAQLLRDFMREFVQQQQGAADHEAWFRRQVQAGLDSANAGRLTPDDQVEERFAARRDATRRRLKSSR